MKNQMTTDTQSRSAGTSRVDREGFAMVTALLVVLVLSVLAVGATWLASSEKKTTVAEALHVRSVFAADAGSEAGINFIVPARAASPSLSRDCTRRATGSRWPVSLRREECFGVREIVRGK